MDYLLLSTLADIIVRDIVITYDIGCQHSVNFPERNDSYAVDLRIDLDDFDIRWAIPKKHLPAHRGNHSRFSLNFLHRVGRTYGEGIESAWSHMNPISMSTREMAPGTRHEVLDCHWNNWNHEKLIAFGTSTVIVLSGIREHD